MSKSSLRDILELLPEPCQERAILDCLLGMLSRGDWRQVDVFLPLICKLSGHQTFKAMAIGIAAKCAIRARDFPLAMERLEILSGFGTGADVLNSRAEALFQLAIQLLPENPSPVSKLWHEMLTENLRTDTQRTLGHIGFLVANAFTKIGDTVNANKVMQAMRANLDKTAVDWLDALLMPKKRGKF